MRHGPSLRIGLIIGVLSVIGLHPATAIGASPAAHVMGGGAGTFRADLDSDLDIDGSRFGMGVSILGGGSARGHFECLMAGDSDILGLPLMAVEGTVTEGSADSGTGTATFSGVATVNLANGTIFRGVGFEVTVNAGGPGTGTLQLTVIGAFDGVPGDQVVGNANYDLPTEFVERGRISVQ
jgi:hypothetical protein